MKTRLTLWLLAAMLVSSAALLADETITVSAQSEDISQNLDLKAVATVFGQSSSLEEFERSLNDDTRINNLDLNGDGEVDYLRVIETGEGNKRLVVIQAVLAQDIYQDVASILVEKDEITQQTAVQIVGDEYIYGANYIIEPVYLHVPVIYDYFWRPYYTYWASPYYWGFWPSYWAHYTCWAWADYWWHIRNFHHVHHYCSYRHVPHHRRGFEDLQRHVARNDMAVRQPERSFAQRNQGMHNSRDISPNRTIINRGASSSNADMQASRIQNGQNAGRTAMTAGNGGRTGVQTTGRMVRSQSDFNNSRTTTASRFTATTGARGSANGSATVTTGSRTAGNTATAGRTSGSVATSGSRATSYTTTSGSRTAGNTATAGRTSGSVTTSGNRATSYTTTSGSRSYSGSSSTVSAGGRTSSYSGASYSGSYSSGSRGTSSSYSSGSRGTSSYSSGSRSSFSGSGSYSSGASRSSFSGGGGYSSGGRSSSGFSGGGGHSAGGGGHSGGTGRR